MSLSDPDPKVRMTFVKKLASQRDPAVVPHLLQALSDADLYVRKEAADALGEWDEPEVVEALLDVVLDEWGDPKWPPGFAVAARSSLARMAGFRTWLLSALRNEDETLRNRASEAIGRVDAPIGRVRTVQDFAREKDVEVLVACLEHGSLEVRLDAADALGEVGDSTALSALERASADEASGVCSAAEEAVERIRSLSEGDEIDRLIDRLRVNALDERKESVRRLGEAGGDRAVDALVGLLSDPDWLFPYVAYETGKKINSPPDSLALEFPTAVVEAVIATKDSRSVELLIGVLGLREPAVRLAAARGLGSVRNERALGPLAWVAKNDPYKYFPDMDSNLVRYPVREVAEEALGAMGSGVNEVPAADPSEIKSAIETHASAVVKADAWRVVEGRLPWSAEDVDKIWMLSDEEIGAVAEVLLKRIEQDPPAFESMARNASLCRLMVSAVKQGGERGERAGASVLRVILGRHRALDRGRKKAGIAGMWPDNVEIITEAWACLDELEARHAAAAADLEKDDVEALVGKLELNLDVRADITTELGKRGDGRAVGPLLGVLGEAYATKDRGCADRVVKALTSIARVEPAVVAEGLSHEAAEVRWAVAQLLGDVGAPDAVPALMGTRDDPDDGVREAVSVALERIEGRTT